MVSLKRLYLPLALVLWTVALPAAAETVRFPTAAMTPALQQKLTGNRGIAAAPQQIAGELYRPEGRGPFPAVIGLHGCGGRRQAWEDTLGAQVTAMGWVMLSVDSFGPRGVRHRCVLDAGTIVDRVRDAYGALDYLASLPFVDADRVAVMGFSQGAMVALSAVRQDVVGTLSDRRFRTAVAYYPWCLEQTFAVPALVLIGELDDWTPASVCRAAMARRPADGPQARLVVYPGARHGFNFPWPGPTMVLGHRLEYDDAATRAAWEETVATLRAAFAR